jgi:hypothetical protein
MCFFFFVFCIFCALWALFSTLRASLFWCSFPRFSLFPYSVFVVMDAIAPAPTARRLVQPDDFLLIILSLFLLGCWLAG